jgi:hypothetical protein
VVQEAEFNRVHIKRAELQLAKVSPTQAIATSTRIHLEQSACTLYIRSSIGHDAEAHTRSRHTLHSRHQEHEAVAAQRLMAEDARLAEDDILKK